MNRDICHQVVLIGDHGASYWLHGLNAVFCDAHGWYRIDARGDKPGVTADFCPPLEQLAFPVKEGCERDLPEIWAEPLPIVISVLESYSDVTEVFANLPDIELLPV